MSTVLHPASPAPLRLLQRPARAARALQPAVAAAHAGWLDRLADWADRQPPHHRMGSLDALRHR